MEPDHDSQRDRYQACLLGLAIGDALGWPTEFLSTHDIRHRFGTAGVTDFEAAGGHPPGTFTDDTQMTLALAEGLLEAHADEPKPDLDTIMAAVGRHFVAWHRSPDNNRAPGNTCSAACRNLAAGAPWRQAGIAHSKGCGTAMRAAPVGLYYVHQPDQLIEVGQASAIITHGHPHAVSGAVAVAAAVATALDTPPAEKVLQAVIEATAPTNAPFAELMARVPERLDEPPEQVLAEWQAWVAEEAVAAALYCFLRSPTDYRRTVLTGANADGDSDTIACIAGAISGAYNGTEALPEPWRANVEAADHLVAVAGRLYQQRPTPRQNR